MVAKRALICGISGQDGAYLARFLLDRGYEVHGTSRDPERASFARLAALGILERARLHAMPAADTGSVRAVLVATRPDEIYNLSGQSSVGLSFEQPVQTFESIAVGTLNLLEGLRTLGLRARLFNAASGECFGDTGGEPADEDTPFRPRSPYAVAKAAAFWQAANHRDAYGTFACSGILFNHESPLRSERFVTRKIVAAACRIRSGSQERLALGNLDVVRDWGWAPEYVAAMWTMLQQHEPADYVLATGHSFSLAAFVEQAFAAVGLDWAAHVTRDPALTRPLDIVTSRANPARAATRLGWRATMRMPEVVAAMVAADSELQASR